MDLELNQDNVIPIAFFAYARPNHTKQTLDALKRNHVPLIYAFCDGAKDETKQALVDEVRNFIKNIDWAKVIIKEQDHNLGLGTSIRAGVTEVLSKHDKVIVIEDDIVMRPGAYDYTCDAMRFYENDERVMTVSMWNHPVFVPKNAVNGFFSERFMCWGWGTYRKYWDLYVENPLDVYYKSIITNPKLLKWGKDLKIQALNAEKYNVWYVGYALLHFLQGKLSFYPYESLIKNIGMDSSATHTSANFVPEENVDIFKPVKNFIFKPQKKIFADTKKIRFYFDHKNVKWPKRHFKKIKRKTIKILNKLFE